MDIDCLSKNKNNYINMVCTGRTNQGATLCDVRHSEKIHIIESTVSKKINEHSLNIVNNSLNQQTANNNNINENTYKLKLIKMAQKIQNLISNMASANNTAMNYINTELSKLEIKRIELTEMLKKYKISSSIKERLIIIEMGTLTFDGKRKIALDIIGKIYILGNNIDITCK